jgi:hypothetical protein
MWNEPSGASGNYLPVCRLGHKTYASTRAARPRATAARRLRACAADTARSYVREHVEGRRRRLRASRGDASGQWSSGRSLSARKAIGAPPFGEGLLRGDQPTPRKPQPTSRSDPELDRREKLKPVRQRRATTSRPDPRTRSPRNIETCPTTGRATGSRRPQELCLDRSTTTKKCALSPKSSASPTTSTPAAKKPDGSSARTGYRARRWVVERSHSWLNRFRRILTSWRNGPTPTSQCSTSPAPSSPGAPPTGDAYRNRL